MTNNFWVSTRYFTHFSFFQRGSIQIHLFFTWISFLDFVRFAKINHKQLQYTNTATASKKSLGKMSSSWRKISYRTHFFFIGNSVAKASARDFGQNFKLFSKIFSWIFWYEMKALIKRSHLGMFLQVG